MASDAAASGGKDDSAAGTPAAADDRISRMTIDEIENGQKCCTICPPRISCVCCRREDGASLKKASLGFFGANRRKCTDMLCLVFFGLFWVGMIVIGSIALSQGNAESIFYGSDYNGDTCGVGSNANDRFTAYPRMIEDFVLNAGETNPSKWRFYGVCVNSCPGRLEVVCNAEAKKVTPAILSSQSALRWCLTGGADGTSDPRGQAWCDENKVEGNCWIIPTATKSTLFRCIPEINTTTAATETCSYPPGITDPLDGACLVKTVTSNGVSEEPAKESQLLQQLATVQSLWSRYFGDIQRAFVPIIVCSIAIVVVLGIAYLLLLQYCTWLIVMTTIAFVLIGLTALAAFSYFKAGIFTSPEFANTAADNFGVTLGATNDEASRQSHTIFAYIFTALAVISLILVVVLRNSIATAVATISLASQALRKNTSLLLTPLISTLGVVALLAWWAFTAASLMSITTKVDVGAITNGSATGAAAAAAAAAASSAVGFNATSFVTLEADSTMTYLQFYNLFGLLWTGQFIIYVGFLSISGAVSAWYFSRDNGECKTDDVPVFDINDEPSPCCGILSCSGFRSNCFQACHRTFRFHLGSIAFASFVVAVIAMIRLIVAYIQKKMEQAKADNNTVLRAVMCYIQYYLSVVDCLVRMMSRTAFVFVAIKGYSFVPASGKALGFVVGNLATFGMLNALSTVIFFLGKLLMAGTAAGCCYAFLEAQASTYQVTSTWLPAAVTFIFGYIVAATFLDLYDACIDTVLVAYVMDGEENGGKRYHTKDKADKGDAALDMDSEVEQAKGVQDGTKKPRPTRGCCFYCCCCCLCRSRAEVSDSSAALPAASTPAEVEA